MSAVLILNTQDLILFKMLINRNNYENFFLLYVDGELSAADGRLVEDFAAANSDLRRELEMLKQTMLPKDEIAFEEKSSLYRSSIMNESLQEKLLLKLDDELPETEFALVNAAIANDEIAGRVYAQLRETKLDASEKFVFADRHLLYRKEKDNVVIFQLLRWAAAAVILGFGIFFGITALNKKKLDGTVAVKVPAVQNVPGTNKPSTNSADDLAAGKQPAIVKNVPAENNVKEIGIAKNSTPKNSTRDLVKPTLTNNTDPRNVKTPEQSPLLVKKENDRVPLQKTLVEDPQQQLASVAVKEKIKAAEPVDNNIAPLENVYAGSASLKEDDGSGNKILYMDEDEVKRSRAGGLLRKVKRFVERTAKIKTGNTLRIASFELAAN